MTMKNDTKFEKELTCQFKINMRNLTNFDRALENLKKFHFNGLLLTNYIIPELRKYRGVLFDGMCVWLYLFRHHKKCLKYK